MNNELALLRDAAVVAVAVAAVLAFAEVAVLPNLLAFVSQLTAAVACSVLVLRVMNVV
jgi:hypothetical protein